MFETLERDMKETFDVLEERIRKHSRRITVLEERNDKEDRGDFLPANGHNQFDLDEIERLKQKLKEATNENSDLSDHLRHLQRRVHDFLDEGPNPSGDPNTGNI